MFNPATVKTDDGFNVFTRYLKSELDAGRSVKVKLRNGQLVGLEWFVGTDFDEGVEHFCYIKDEFYLIWDNEGISITSSDFDIMESV